MDYPEKVLSLLYDLEQDLWSPENNIKQKNEKANALEYARFTIRNWNLWNDSNEHCD